MLKNGKFCSKWVDNVRDENCSHAVNLNYVKDFFDINEHTFIVWDANNKLDTSKVYYLDDKPHEYKCGIFISLKVGSNIIFSFFLNKLFTNILFLSL